MPLPTLPRRKEFEVQYVQIIGKRYLSVYMASLANHYLYCF